MFSSAQRAIFRQIMIWLFLSLPLQSGLTGPALGQMDYMEPLQVTPKMLVEDFKRNFHEADAKYTGKLLILTGRIRTINPEQHPYMRHDYPFITMDSGNNQPVVVYFWEWEAEKIGRMRTGSTISVMGFCQGVLPQLSLYGACIYPGGCGGPKADFYGPYFKLPPSPPFSQP